MNNHDNPDNQQNNRNQGSGNINVRGDIHGGGVIIGHHITTRDVIVSINESLEKNPNNEYLQGLKELTEKLSREYEKYNVPEDKRISINESIQDLQNEAKNIKPETELKDLSLSQQKQIDAKTTTLAEKVIDALPATSETIASFIPVLSPFSKLIGGGVQKVVDSVKEFKRSKS